MLQSRYLKSFLGALLALVTACGDPAAFSPESALGTRSDAVTVPAKGTASGLDIASWNLEWFGDTTNGPTDEALQLQNVRDVIGGADMDIWGLEEVVDVNQFNSLVSQLPGYAGLVANDPSVVDGPAYYSGFSNAEQKVAILYKTSVATVLGAKVICTANDYDFGGRPPLEVRMRVSLNGNTEDLVIIVLHAKAISDVASWQRRQNASIALKSYLDTTWPTQKVLVIGDFNDDVDTSTTKGKPSPYANFVSDTADYFFPTKALTDAGISSTTSYPDMIDHHLITNEVQGIYVANSAEVYRVDAYVPNYGTTTTDHFPVLSHYTWSGTGGGTATLQLTAPNGGESWAGGSTQSITWNQSGVSSVKLEDSLDNGGTWSVITASTPASTGSYAWTVPGSASTQALIRVSDASNASLADTSNAAFTITTSGGSPGQVILNEILANEPGTSTSGEFIELYNAGGSSVDLSGWTISDATSVRHTFPSGTTLAAGKALVVTGSTASTGTLSLNNSGDTVTLKNGATVVDSFTYGSSLASQDGVSMNRSPDASATGTFVLHNTLSALSSSAGTRVDGTAF